jgi:hypothetical protein
MATYAVRQKWIQNFQEIYDYLVKSDNEANIGGTEPTLTEFYTADAARNALSVFYAIVPERRHGMAEHNLHEQDVASTESAEEPAENVPSRGHLYLADIDRGDSGSENVHVDDHTETAVASVDEVLLQVVNSDEIDNYLEKTLANLDFKSRGECIFEGKIFGKIFSDREREPDRVDWAFFRKWEETHPNGLPFSPHFLHERVERSLENSDQPEALVKQLWQFASSVADRDSTTVDKVLGGQTDFVEFVHIDLEKRRYDGDTAAPLKLQEVSESFRARDMNDGNGVDTVHTDNGHELLNLNSLAVNKPLTNLPSTAVDSEMHNETPPNVFADYFDVGDAQGNTVAKDDTSPDIKKSLESTLHSDVLGDDENINGNVVIPKFVPYGSNVPGSLSRAREANGNQLETKQLVAFGNGAFKPTSKSSSGNNSVESDEEISEFLDPADSGRSSENLNETDNGNRANSKSPFFPLVGPRFDFNVHSEDNRNKDRQTSTTPFRRTPDKNGVWPPLSEREPDRILRTPTARNTPVRTPVLGGGSRRLRGSSGTAVHTLRHQKWNKEKAQGKK